MKPKHANTHEQFLTVFTANEPAIRAFVRRLVPTRQDAADVMQCVALVLWRKFDQLDERDSFRKWAFGVARLEVLAWRRDAARDRLVLSEEVLEAVASDSSAAESQLAAHREALESCLEKLPAEHRTLVLAAYQPETQIQTVADKSGRTVAAFYQWLHRVRVRLLECTRRTSQAEGLL